MSTSRIAYLIFQVLIYIALIGAVFPDTFAGQKGFIGSWPTFDCPQCIGQKIIRLEQEQTNAAAAISKHLPDKDIDIIVTYSDISGDVRIKSVKSKDLSASWVWKNPIDDHTQNSKPFAKPLQFDTRFEDSDDHYTNESLTGDEIQHPVGPPVHPLKIKRQKLRLERRKRRTLELIEQGKEIENEMNAAAAERARTMDTTVMGRYIIWRTKYENPNSDSTLKVSSVPNLSIIHVGLCFLYIFCSLLSALDRAKEMGHILALAKDQL
ncbi:hypothetical protein ACET3Z_006287 [Daucus carota]